MSWRTARELAILPANYPHPIDTETIPQQVKVTRIAKPVKGYISTGVSRGDQWASDNDKGREIHNISNGQCQYRSV